MPRKILVKMKGIQIKMLLKMNKELAKGKLTTCDGSSSI